MSGLNLIRAYNDLIVATGALWLRTHTRAWMCVCVCVITGAGCTGEQNGCIIGNVRDTAWVFFSSLPSAPLLSLLSPACWPDSNYRGFSGEERPTWRRRRPHRLILSTDGLFCLQRRQAARNPWSAFGTDPGTGHINKF